MILFPNAKINIGLDILRKRPDGYHDISTIMIPTGWTDILEIVETEGGDDQLSTTGLAIDCALEKNLVMRAVRIFRQRYDFPAVNIGLHKLIPDGAGLGGGSADAAFTLKGINSLFSLGVEDSELVDMASQLGADCAFFVYNKPMLCEGVGNIMRPVDVNKPDDLHLVIVKPSVSVATAAAYRNVSPSIPSETIESIVSSYPIGQWQGRLKNDFETSVFAQYPEVGYVKMLMLDLGAVYASMSGSGSAVYGFFPNEDSAQELAHALPAATIHMD